MGGNGERAGNERQSWTALFDPVSNARVLAEIQAEGLRAAGELIDHMARATDGERPAFDGTTAGEPAGPRSSDASRLIEAWIDLLQRLAGSLASSSNGHESAGTSSDVHLGTGHAGETFRVELDASGITRSGSTEIWLHNGTADAIGHIALHCKKLRSSDGHPLGAALRFDPAEIDSLPARSSRGFAVNIASKGGLVPGSYRGVIQARGAPEVWMAVEVVVLAAASRT